jgi:hypothetical protein
MAKRQDWSFSILDKFAQYNPTDEDIDNVDKAYQTFQDKPVEEATPIPFERPELKDCYVIWTPDRKWRLLLRKRNPKGYDLLGVEPETGI